ncbi:hypothetical protein NGRA_0692 [Nosema granulosis]|uniref:Uncharacterized protein n=1 Tax=Nosema granulosis TaxID=83296 RepID=A0A9P6H0E2_9MICR|nr:hypothetical protein NGRA_0692 [Nosema granulosis]
MLPHNFHMETLQNEFEILQKIYRNYKNHLKSSILLNRMNEVRKLTLKFISNNSPVLKSKLKEKCLDLYIAVSNIYTMGHYKVLCLVLFGLTSRIYKAVD